MGAARNCCRNAGAKFFTGRKHICDTLNAGPSAAKATDERTNRRTQTNRWTPPLRRELHKIDGENHPRGYWAWAYFTKSNFPSPIHSHCCYHSLHASNFLAIKQWNSLCRLQKLYEDDLLCVTIDEFTEVSHSTRLNGSCKLIFRKKIMNKIRHRCRVWYKMSD